MNAVHTLSHAKGGSANPGPDSGAHTVEHSGPQHGAPYVVQLAASAAAIDPATIPQLDIFDVYRLYSKVGVAHGVVCHALRLGFFKEVRTAKTVARYLASYFDAPTIVQVGASEEARAAQHSLAALKDIGASGRHAIIELSTPRGTPVETRPPASTPPPRYSARASLWARLLTSLRR